MAWGVQKHFPNMLNQADYSRRLLAEDNAAGVCEAAVCLWIKHIHDRIGKFNFGFSAGDYVPSRAEANDLHNQLNLTGKYEGNNGKRELDASYQFYLSRNVWSKRPRAGARIPPSVNVLLSLDCHFSLSASAPLSEHFGTLVRRLKNGDAVFLGLFHENGGHAVGIYRGSDYIWVFDPDNGLLRGNLTAGCCRSADIEMAIGFLEDRYGDWAMLNYYGVHLR